MRGQPHLDQIRMGCCIHVNTNKGSAMSEKILRIFVGFDPVESVAWHTMVHSIFKRASVPIAVTPLYLGNLGDVYTRPRDPRQSNQFSFTRFLVPFLSDYSGWSVYFDCDMMLRADIKTLFDLADPDKAVMVVKHAYEPRDNIKYLGARQHRYAKKNWSSVMLFNNGRCRALTPEYVNTAPGLDLHQFKWLESESLIGELPVEWNWLVGEYESAPAGVKNVHWTVGGPYFRDYADADFAHEWFAERNDMAFCKQRD